MRRFVAAALLPLVFLVGCGAEATQDDRVTYTPPEQDNVTEAEAPVTNYNNPQGYNVQVWTITENGHECIIASSTQAVSIVCEGMGNTVQ